MYNNIHDKNKAYEGKKEKVLKTSLILTTQI